MARFYGSLSGQARTEATRRGGASSGVTAHVRGWRIGARVEVVDVNGKDVVRVYKTGGSNDPSGELVAEFQEGTSMDKEAGWDYLLENGIATEGEE